MYELMKQNRDKERLYHKQFQDIFHVSLKSYFDHVYGFDVIKFDEVVKPLEDESTHDAVARQWGYDAVDLVYKLIHWEVE